MAAETVRIDSEFEYLALEHSYDQVPRPKPSIEVRPGDGRRLDTEQYTRALKLFKTLVAAAVLLTVMAVARIWLLSSSLDLLNQTSDIEASIEEARQIGEELETQYYAASNSNNISEYAAQVLGMSAVEGSTELIDISPDFVSDLMGTLASNIQLLEEQAQTAAEAETAAEAAVQASASQ